MESKYKVGDNVWPILCIIDGNTAGTGEGFPDYYVTIPMEIVTKVGFYPDELYHTEHLRFLSPDSLFKTLEEAKAECSDRNNGR
jgi:hypothetical protein